MNTDWTETHHHIWAEIERSSYKSPFIDNPMVGMYIDYQIEEAVDDVLLEPMYQQLTAFHSNLAEE